MGFSKRKYGNKKIEVDGVKFDSELEMKCYNLLKEMGFSFEFQKQITLVDKFRYNKEAIRAITIVVDFVLDHDGKIIYIDTKGFATEVSKIKYKMLRYMLKDEENTDVVWLHTQKEVSDYLIKLKEER